MMYYLSQRLIVGRFSWNKAKTSSWLYKTVRVLERALEGQLKGLPNIQGGFTVTLYWSVFSYSSCCELWSTETKHFQNLSLV